MTPIRTVQYTQSTHPFYWCQASLWGLRYLQQLHRTINTKQDIQRKRVRLLRWCFRETKPQLQLNWIFNDAAVVINDVTPATQTAHVGTISFRTTTQSRSSSQHKGRVGLLVGIIGLAEAEQLYGETGFLQVRQNKIPGLFRLFHITLKYFQAFRGAFYNQIIKMIFKIWLTFTGQGH